MSRCLDCPDLPHGTRKRPVCCRREPALKVGDVVPLPARKLDVRPTFDGESKASFRPARHANRAPGR